MVELIVSSYHSIPAGKFKSITPEAKRSGRRAWELWSKEDQALFFDGLCEVRKQIFMKMQLRLQLTSV